MSELDASDIGNLAVRVGLITLEQQREAAEELQDTTAHDMVKALTRKGWLTQYQASKLLKGETDGYILGGYRLLYKIASGSFGRVYRADNPSTGEEVAVKVLRRRWLEHPDKIELFEREGKVGLTLQHPNIVRVVACSKDQSSGQYYLVMEFVEGGNVRDILNRRERIDVPQALKMIEECAHGLAFALTRGLTHRDIKQTNILISSSGNAKLVDFGLAAIAQGGSADFGEKGVEVARTVEYAGLERATGCKAGDPRSDIFFLGCVFFEMISGSRLLPSSRERRGQLTPQHFQVAERVRMQSGLEVHPKVISLIEKMAAYDPDERFQNPNQLIEVIASVRAEVSGEKRTIRDDGPKTVFVVEEHPKLQDVFRQKIREMGLRVLISIDPNRALQRYKEEPYHALVMDAGTAGLEGVEIFERVMTAAELSAEGCLGILILSEDQRHWKNEVRDRLNVEVLTRPVTMKQITARLSEIVPAEQSST